MLIPTLHGNKIDSEKISSIGYSVIKVFGVPIKDNTEPPNYRDFHFWAKTENGIKHIIKNFYDEDNAKLFLLDFLKNLYDRGEFLNAETKTACR